MYKNNRVDKESSWSYIYSFNNVSIVVKSIVSEKDGNKQIIDMVISNNDTSYSWVYVHFEFLIFPIYKSVDFLKNWTHQLWSISKTDFNVSQVNTKDDWNSENSKVFPTVPVEMLVPWGKINHNLHTCNLYFGCL